MPLTQKHKDQLIKAFCIIFYALMLYKLFNGMSLYQLQPHIFNTRFDFVSWLFMDTGIHIWLLDNPSGWVILDIVFYIMPLVYILCYKISTKASTVAAVAMLFVNIIYIQCYTLYPANSIESFIAWLLFPLLFMTQTLQGFYLVLNGLRYFILFFFASAGIWKIAQGGIFNLGEMSGILLYQHKEYLISSPTSGFTTFIYWLVEHPKIGYLLYFIATAIELFFITGFFTKRLDKLLILAFFAFIIMDVIIMRIPYFEITPFLLALLFSKYAIPEDKPENPTPQYNT